MCPFVVSGNVYTIKFNYSFVGVVPLSDICLQNIMRQLNTCENDMLVRFIARSFDGHCVLDAKVLFLTRYLECKMFTF